ncbi:hypothetical protein [Salinigranum sp. GCM10025319]|uniref:hypothetical protein n=1 Tax=Salinigranum sp. GCM10025319 TaxID=3252687 RepID=UPI0036123186
MATNVESGDAFAQYFGIRGKYLAQLRERGFVGRNGSLTAGVIGSVFQPAPGGEAEWERHCREHPNDPICLLGARADVRTEELFEIRDDYLESIAKAGLVDVQRGVSDMVAVMSGVSMGTGGSVGLVSPDDPNADDIINNPLIGPKAREFAVRMLF